MNDILLDKTLNIVIQYFSDTYDVKVNSKVVNKRIISWYSNTDITNEYELAAMAIYSEYNPRLSYRVIQMITNNYFPRYKMLEEQVDKVINRY